MSPIGGLPFYLQIICLTFLTLQKAEATNTVLHVITHSHLDAGWVYDVDQCYVISNFIFTAVLDELVKRPERKYTVGDLYFFQRWYNEDENRKELVK